MSEYVMPTRPPQEGWDLHCHTVFSDGTRTPREMVQEAKSLGLHGVAIADHDTTAGWEEAGQASHDLHLPLMRGTEITAQDGNVSVHMLAYLYDPRNRHICDLFEKTRRSRVERTKKMVALLAKDYPISWQSVLEQTKEGSRTTIGRPHIADALVAAGVYANRNEAFADAVSTHSKYYIPTPSPSTSEVVRAVEGAGGVSVIAHAADPSRNRVLLSTNRLRASPMRGLTVLRYGIAVIPMTSVRACLHWHSGITCSSPEARTGMGRASRTRLARISPMTPPWQRSYGAVRFRCVVEHRLLLA